MATVYMLAPGQPIPRDVEDYDGALVSGQTITIRLGLDDVWHVRGEDPLLPLMVGEGCSYVIGQRNGVFLHPFAG